MSAALLPSFPANPPANAQVFRLSYGPISGWSWVEGRSPELPPGDVVLFAPVGEGRLRLAVLDPVELSPHMTRLRSQEAVGVVFGLLRSGVDIGEAFQAANRRIHDPSLPFAYDNACVSAAAVDIDLSSRRVVAAGRAADCEVWVLSNGRWSPLFPFEIRSQQAWAEYRSHLTPDISRLAQYELQNKYFGTPDAWSCTTLGFFAEPKLEFASHDAPVDAVVVSTDGAELSSELLSRLDSWLCDDLQNRTPTPPHPHPHGDLGLVFLDLTGA